MKKLGILILSIFLAFSAGCSGSDENRIPMEYEGISFSIPEKWESAYPEDGIYLRSASASEMAWAALSSFYAPELLFTEEDVIEDALKEVFEGIKYGGETTDDMVEEEKFTEIEDNPALYAEITQIIDGEEYDSVLYLFYADSVVYFFMAIEKESLNKDFVKEFESVVESIETA